MLLRRRRSQAANGEGEDCDRARPFASVARDQTLLFRTALRRWLRFAKWGWPFRDEQQIRAEQAARAERERQAWRRRRHRYLRDSSLPKGGGGAVYWRSEWRAIRACFAALRSAAFLATERRSWSDG